MSQTKGSEPLEVKISLFFDAQNYIQIKDSYDRKNLKGLIVKRKRKKNDEKSLNGHSLKFKG